VVIAQCYVAEAAKEGFEESLVRMKAYKEIAEVGWVQLTAPGSVEQMKWARDAVEGPSSIMQAYMDPLLSKKELLNLGINLLWMARPTHDVTYVALDDFIKDSMERVTSAWDDFQKQHEENSSLTGDLKIGGVQVAKHRELEERYLSDDSPGKYDRSTGREP